MIIRNNTIAGNELYADPYYANGTVYYSHSAGIGMDGQGNYVIPLIYNNLIYNNHAHDGEGGGIASWENANPVIYNNTIMNNRAERGGKQIYLAQNTKVILFNNILWSDTDDSLSEIHILPDENSVLIARYNNIKGGWEGESNISINPRFEVDSYNLSDSSLCIGCGIESIEIEGTWYYAPLTDLNNDTRPHACDNLVDLGAIESPYLCPVRK